MAIDIEETMTVKAPDSLVWNWLLNAENTIGCLPGAKLEEVIDPRHFTARMKVKVGTVSLTYKGDIELTEVDEAERKVFISGKWKEVGGSGSATMELTGKVIPREDGSTDVQFVGMADPVGRIVQFGKGMMQGVGAQLFTRFSNKASARMEKAALEADFAGDDAGSAAAAEESAAAQQAAAAASAQAEAAVKAAQEAAAASTGGADLGPAIAMAEAAAAKADAASAKADAAFAKAEEALAKATSAYEMAQKAGEKVTELATAGADEDEELNGIAVFFQWLASLFGGGKKKKKK